VENGVRSQGLTRFIDKLETASWVGEDSDGFLNRAQVTSWVAMIYMAKKLLRRHTGVFARVYVNFCVECGMCETGVSTSGVSTIKTLFEMRLHICKHTLHRACTCARVCAVFSLALGGEGGWVSSSLYKVLFAWRGRLFLTEVEIKVLSCVFFIFDAGKSVCMCTCRYTHTNTHTARGVLGVGSRPGTRSG